MSRMGFPGGSVIKNPPADAGDQNLIPGSGRSPGEKKRQPTPIFLPGKSHGQRSLAGYSPWGCKKVGNHLATKQHNNNNHEQCNTGKSGKQHSAVLTDFSCVRFFATLWTVAHQAPLSTGFFRQEYWSGFPFPSPEDPPDTGIEPTCLMSSALAGGLFTTSTTWEVRVYSKLWNKIRKPGSDGHLLNFSNPLLTRLLIMTSQFNFVLVQKGKTHMHDLM